VLLDTLCRVHDGRLARFAVQLSVGFSQALVWELCETLGDRDRALDFAACLPPASHWCSTLLLQLARPLNAG
jgi:hypothetical protein